jgi:hypothetical protein
MRLATRITQAKLFASGEGYEARPESEQPSTAFNLIFQAIAIGFYPALFAAGFLERVPVRDHAQMDMPPPILTRNVLVKATGGLVATSREILFRFVEPIRRSGSREGQREEKNDIAGS